MNGLERVLALGTSEQIDALLAEVAAEPERRRQESRRTWTAIMLARDLDVCRALLQGEHVQRHRLDAKWLHLLERWPERAA